jgi:GTP-binding protein Era
MANSSGFLSQVRRQRRFNRHSGEIKNMPPAREPLPHEPQSEFKAGFVGIVGAPNAGKSTLLNRLLGEKISITSKKPQTTRNRILGILNSPGAQMVFIDTPGVHRAKTPLNKRIVEVALSVLTDADLILMVVDAAAPDTASEKLLLAKLKASRKPIILVLNKVDLVDKRALLTIIDTWPRTLAFQTVVPISAKHGTQLDVLMRTMQMALPPGPPYFPQESLTDMPERFIVAELIREKAIRLTGQEIPYAVAVTIERYKTRDDGKLIAIHATLHVERESQKGIIIGQGGRKLKQIGAAARKEIQDLVQNKVFLKLFVRVQKNWRKDTKALRKFGY